MGRQAVCRPTSLSPHNLLMRAHRLERLGLAVAWLLAAAALVDALAYVASAHPLFADLQARTSRTIPVVALRRSDTSDREALAGP